MPDKSQPKPKKLPEVPSNASEDIPPDTGHTGHPNPNPVPTPEQKHSWEMELMKNSIALFLILLCIIISVIPAVSEWIRTGKVDPVNSILDMLKMILTTSVGYIFGRHTR